jgi:hypothetical protein
MAAMAAMFRSDLFHTTAGTDEQRQQLINELYDLKSKDSRTLPKTNPGCWRRDNPLGKIDWLQEPILNLLDNAVGFYRNIDKNFKETVEENRHLHIYYWANINAPGSKNTMHAHRQNHFAVVYYLQGTGTGALRFPNPSNMMGECLDSGPFVRDFIFTPTDGDLILFPAHLPHEVETNLSNKDRINLAFNLTLTREPT